MTIHIVGGRILKGDGSWVETDLFLHDGRIARIGSGTGVREVWDASGLLVLPGIVDLHGDAFERQIMPRPGVSFPLDLALLESDRQMAANGITTAYHGLTWSWEPGLRGREVAFAFLDTLESLNGRLSCDTRVHLRHEIYNLDAVVDILAWVAAGRIHLLAFNDHLPEFMAKVERPDSLASYAARAGTTTADFAALVGEVRQRAERVPESVEMLAQAARMAGLPMASHDDDSAEIRSWYSGLGCRICEFPVTEEAARCARSLGDVTVMGAPNVLRGGSHVGRLDAAAIAGQGLCGILTSDYFYPALLAAPFRLMTSGRFSLAAAWATVSSNPARAAGLKDRGVIEVGRRADILLVDAADPALPRVVATVVAGRPVHVSEAWRLRV